MHCVLREERNCSLRARQKAKLEVQSRPLCITAEHSGGHNR